MSEGRGRGSSQTGWHQASRPLDFSLIRFVPRKDCMDTRIGIQTQQTRSLAMTNQLRHAIGLLSFGNQALLEHLVTLAEANPNIVVGQSLRSAAQRSWIDLLTVLPAGAKDGAPGRLDLSVGRQGGGAADVADLAVSAPPGLQEHVRIQINLALREPSDRRVAEAFAEALEPSGWISRGPAEIARDCGCAPEQAEAVLARLQQIEPAGLFARSLAECLRLQAIDMDVLTPDFALMLDNLRILARGDLDALAELCGCDLDRMQQMVRVLRGMNPKPGSAFDGTAPPITEPDLIVRRSEGGWLVELNRSNLPAVEVREAPGVGGSPEELREARWLERAVFRRNATTLLIAHAVVSRQGAFLKDGPGQMKPLSFAEVADSTALHQSTVSRVTSGLLVATPRGTLRFRDFFSPALGMTGPEARIATAVVLHDLKTLIAAEDPLRPLRDEDIAVHFQGRGITLARRTVAKYRGLLRIAASSQRQRSARLPRRGGGGGT